VGKTSTARIFAKALNDPSGPNIHPDQHSDVAQAIDAGEDVDVIEIDGASNRGIDEIRSLRANVGVRPSRSRYKIYIIDEVHMLTAAAFNALLKTLEEPPEHVKFIFCTTDPEKIPITVLSRCQRFDFAPVEFQKIVERLRFIVDRESADADQEALELIARRAAGSMRDSQSLLEQVLSFCKGKLTVDQVHTMLGTANDERLHALATALAERDSASALRQLDAGIDAGVDAGRLAEQLLGYFRDLMAVAVGCDATLLRHTSAAYFPQLKQLGEAWGLQTVLAIVAMLDQTLVRIRHSVYSRVLLEATLIQVCTLPDLQQLADLAAASRAVAAKPEKKKPSVTPAAEVSWAEVVVHPAQGHAAAAPHLSTSTSTSTSTKLKAENETTAAMQRDGAGRPMMGGQAVAVANLAWNQSTAEHAWGQTLTHLESMTETFARVVQRVQAVGERTLRLTFPHDGALAKRRCELPEHRAALSAALSNVTGLPITLEFDLAQTPVPEDSPPPATNKPTRLQRMREIEANPLVKSCVELFDAEIVRIEKEPTNATR
jgi:DNA polymerase-3 subunit gamma/tau